MKTLAMIKYTLNEYLHGIGLIILLLVFGIVFLILGIGLSVEKTVTGEKVTFFGQELTKQMPAENQAILEGINSASLMQMSFVALATALIGPVFFIMIGSRIVESLLTRGNKYLLLSKPMARWHLFLSRLAGFLVFSTLLVVLYVGGLWLIVGLKTGIYLYQPIAAAPLIILIYFSLVSIIAIISVITENFFVSAGGTLVIYAATFALGQPRAVMFFESDPALNSLYTVVHAILPRITELGAAVGALYISVEDYDWFTPVWTTLLFSLVLCAAATIIFSRKEY